MTLLNLFAFTFAMFVLAITPGAGVFATVSRAISSGFKNASFLVIGIVLGDIIFLMLAIFGLSLVINLFEEFFLLVKYLGGVYLIFLSYKIFSSNIDEIKLSDSNELSWKKNLITGLLITLSNPKVILFYLGFLPSFMDLKNLSNLDFILIVFIVVFVLSIVMLFYAYFASKAKKIFKSKSSLKNLNNLSGIVMLIAGLLLIFKA